jgi:hypothetical protein
MITIAGLNVGKLERGPKVIGAVSDSDVIKQYKNYGIDFQAGSKVGTIVGASGLFLGLGKYRGIKGICLLGETSGFPIIPDPRSAEAVLNVLTKILNIKIDMSKLEDKVKEMENFMKKIEKVQHRAIGQLLEQQMKKEPTSEEELKYIG